MNSSQTITTKLRLACLVFAAMFTASAQLAPENSAGVSMREVDLNVRDVPASRQFFVALGGKPVMKSGVTEVVEFPGAYITLHKQDPTGGTADSAINHFGFEVTSVATVLTKFASLGYTVEPGTRPTQRMVDSPDGVRIELIENTALGTPIKFHHVHFFLPDPAAAKAWYVKAFGAMPSQRGVPPFDTALLPGVELAFSKAEMPLAAAKGRALDHVGFEVKNVAEIRKKLEADGIVFDGAIHKGGHGSAAKVTAFTDPWGNYIELTEGASAR